MTPPDNPDPGELADLEGDIPIRENLGGWLRLALVTAFVLLLPCWLFVSVALFERMGLPPSVLGVAVAGIVGAVLVLVLVPVPLLLLLGGAALSAVHARWEIRSLRAVEEAVERDAVMTGVAITSRVVGSPSPRARGPAADLAPIGVRVAASGIDAVVACAVAGLVGAPALLWGGSLVGGGTSGAAIACAVGVTAGALAVGGVQAVGLAIVGQTLGKWLLGVRVVGEEGQDVGLVDGVMIRYVAWGLLLTLPVVGWVLAVGDVWALLTDPSRQTLHDQLARTLVVRTPSTPPGGAPDPATA